MSSIRPVELSFLAGGGEMGQRIRAFDWAKTSLGIPESWPHSLKTVVPVILNSRYPMFVWWGKSFVNLYNDAYAPILGKRHPEALGREASEVWSEIWNTVGPQAETVLHEGRPNWFEELPLIIERNKFLEESYFTYSYSPVPDDHGGIGGVFCACTEETHRVIGRRRLRTLRALADNVAQAKNVENALQLAAATLDENVYDVPFALLYLLDGEGRRATLAGWTGLVPGKRASPKMIDLRDGSAPWPLQQVLETGNAAEVTHLLSKFGPMSGGAWPESPQRAVVLSMKKPGQTQPAGFVVAGVSPRLEFNDDYKGFLDLMAGQVAEAIAHARAYEEERKRAEQLAELDRAKTAFFSNVSHEFRTPLTLMLAPVEDLLARSHTDLSPSAKGQLDLVYRNGFRLLRLVNTLLDFSRIEAGRVRAAYEPTDLAAFTGELASVFRAATERAGLKLVVDCPTLPEPAFVDRNMWEKIVLNLISNAFKFTFEGEIEVKLRLMSPEPTAGTESAPASVPHAVLSVRDTGVGIPVDEMPRLFERFHRIEMARSRTHEGSGIGLALVHELVRLHDGTVRADSEPGVGTTFFVSVPLGSTHLPADHIGAPRALGSTAMGAAPFVEEALRWLPEEPAVPVELLSSPQHVPVVCPPGAQATGKRPQVLVADDNADMRHYVTRLLAERYDVVAVSDGEAALAAVQERRPDLILSDVMMPRLDGFGLLKTLRADEATRTLPVILLSARAGEEARVEGLDRGADDYLIKPFSAREILARVESSLKLARARQEAAQAIREQEERLRFALEKTVAERTAKLRETVQELETFSYSIAHDMRAPLRSMQGFSEILLASHEPKFSEYEQDLLRRIAASAARMDRLIQDVLNYSGVVRAELPLEAVNVEPLLRGIVDTYPTLAPDKGDIVLHESFPSVHGNQAMLTQIFSNLLANAVKFVAPGVKPQVRVWAETILPARATDRSRVRVFIQDNGIGIAADQHEKIFGIFQRVSKSYDGTGIGLAIVKKAVERMSGKVGVKSELDRGSTFWIELPKAGE